MSLLSNERYKSSLFTEFPSFTFLREFDQSAETSMYFGFTPITTPKISRADRNCTRNICSIEKSYFICSPEEKTSLLRLYIKNELYDLPYPVMVYYNRPRNITGVTNSVDRHIGLDIIGTSRSVADAIAIKTAFSILEEEGFSDLVVEINSLGDQDSIEKFEHELIQFYRENINLIPPKYQSLIKQDVFDMLQCRDNEVCKEINIKAPQAISFLSDSNRQYFMDVLEHLEELGIPYKISNTVVGNKHISSQTIFSIRESDEQNSDKPTLAMGTRYNRLSRKARLNKDIDAVGVSLCYTPCRKQKRARKTPISPRYFFAHLGDTARRKSLVLIDRLRHERIPIHHSLIHDNISGQIARAQELGMSHIIIMGQKEAVEGTVVIRNMKNLAQETIPAKSLAKYLKNISRRFL